MKLEAGLTGRLFVSAWALMLKPFIDETNIQQLCCIY